MRNRHVGIGLLEVMIAAFFILVVLRLCGVNIPWIYVSLPIWAPLLVGTIIITVIILVAAVQERIERRKRWKWRQ